MSSGRTGGAPSKARNRSSDFLHRHDAYPFFQATGDLVLSGPTGTNVMDVRVVLISKVSTT